MLLQNDSRQRSQSYKTVFIILPEISNPFFTIFDVKLQINLLSNKVIPIPSTSLMSISKSLFLNPVNKSERKTIIQSQNYRACLSITRCKG